MNESPSILKLALYAVIGLFVAIVAIRILIILLAAAGWLIQFALSIAIVVVIGWVVYKLIKNAIKSFR